MLEVRVEHNQRIKNQIKREKLSESTEKHRLILRKRQDQSLENQ